MAQPKIEIVVNGEPRFVEAGSTLEGLIGALDQDPRTVAVERNGQIVPRAQYASRTLEPGDRLEVVRFVQGGTDRSTWV